MDQVIPAEAAQDLLQFAKALEAGDFRRRTINESPGIAGQIFTALEAHRQMLAAYSGESVRVLNEIGVIGRLGPQAEVPPQRGSWHLMVQSLNLLACCLTSQIRDMSQTVQGMEQGDYSRRVTDTSLRGEYEELRERINALANQLEKNMAPAGA